MKRTQKEATMAQLTQELSQAPAIYATDYRGLSVSALSELRTRLRESGGSYRVVKNTLARRVISEQKIPLEDLLKGPTALVICSDPVAGAKAVTAFIKEMKIGEVKGGVLDGQVVSPSSIAAIAQLPAREVLMAQLVGMLAYPLSGLARVLTGPTGGLARCLAQVAQQKES